MDESLSSRFKHAWNIFTGKETTRPVIESGIVSSYYRPDRPRLTRGNERTIVTSIFNRIALDCAAIDIRHVKLDDNGRYLYDIDSDLNNCLTLEANLDQTNRAFIQDAVLSMLDEGCVAIVPTCTEKNIYDNSSYKIYELRVGKIVEWFPHHVKVNVYDEDSGKKKDLILPKADVAIIENPLYAVVNEPNSTLKRLMRKLVLMDIVDEETCSGKLDLIVQLPYVIKTDARKDQANERRKAIEDQLRGSKYGIAYIDGTEHITQLNRPLENNLIGQIEYLTNLLYSQLGITQTVLDGTADEKVMLNYYSRSVEPIIAAITTEMKRKFLTKTARTQYQSIESFRSPFKLVPVSNIAEIADKFTRNEIMTSNEIRQVIGMKPSVDPKADQLINSNIAQPNQGMPPEMMNPEMMAQQQAMSDEEAYNRQMAQLDELDGQLDELEESLG